MMLLGRLGSRLRASSLLRPTAVAFASTAAAFAQPTSPAECSWFGKSKEVLQLESKNASLEDALKQSEEKYKTLEEKLESTTAWMKISESFPKMEDGASMLDGAYDKASGFVAAGFPQEISIGFASGGCVGYATKVALKVAAATTGGMFIFLQLLQYNGIISVNYGRIADLFKSLGDADGDGDIDTDDLKIMYNRYLEIMGHGVATGGGFTSGFLFGFRRA